MQRITPHLWFDKEAKEAGALYTSIFPDSRIKRTAVLSETPSGTVDIVNIQLCGQDFALLSAGPLFKFNPSVSFLVACDTKDEVDTIWRTLSQGGKTLMPVDAYPFSERYGWTEDRYGVSWQVMFAGERKITQKITPTLMFVEKNAGKAEEAIRFYTSVFGNSEVGDINRYGKNQAPDIEGTVVHGSFTIEGQRFAAMDSARSHGFAFNEAISFIVNCETQAEIDYYWQRLSADPKAEQCGWLKDKYGLSWQVTPAVMEQMLASRDEEKIGRVTQAFLQMKKFDIATLQAAYDGDSR